MEFFGMLMIEFCWRRFLLVSSVSTFDAWTQWEQLRREQAEYRETWEGAQLLSLYKEKQEIGCRGMVLSFFIRNPR